MGVGRRYYYVCVGAEFPIYFFSVPTVDCTRKNARNYRFICKISQIGRSERHSAALSQSLLFNKRAHRYASPPKRPNEN